MQLLTETLTPGRSKAKLSFQIRMLTFKGSREDLGADLHQRPERGETGGIRPGDF